MENKLCSKAEILLVDDDVLIAESNKHILKKAGYNSADIAYDGKRAIELAKEKKPDLILMDINLGGSIDGIMAAEEIQKFLDVPFIFLTAYSDPETIERVTRIGPFGFLIKPFDIRELIVTIETSLVKHAFEKKNKERELLFRTVSDFAYEWEFWLSPDLEFRYCSPSCHRVSGYEAEEFIADPKLLFEIVHADDREIFDEHVRCYHSGDKNEPVTDFQFRIIDKQKRIKYISHTCSPIFDERSNFLGRRVTNVDITERKLAQEALRLSDEKIRMHIQATPIAVIEYDKESRLRSWNPAAEHIFGYTASEVIGNHTNFLVPRDLRHKVDRLIDEVLNKRVTIQNVNENVTKDGQTIICEWYNSPLLAPDGSIAGFAAFAIDITERKRKEEELRRTEQVLRLFVEHSPASMAMFDKEMRYIIASKRFKADYKLGEVDLIGKSHYEVFPEISEGWKQIHRNCLAGAVEKNEEDPFPRADGTLDWVRWEIRPWYEKENEIGGIILFSEVITKNKQAADELKKSEERFKQVADCAGIWVWEVDKDGLYTYVSSMEENILGYKPEEIIGKKHFYDFFAPETKAECKKTAMEIFSKKGAFENFENANLNKNGRIVLLETTGIPILDDKMNLLGYRGADRDITERNKLMETLLQLSTAVDQSQISIVITNIKGDIEYVNPYFTEVTGYTKEEALLKNPRILKSGETSSEEYTAMWQKLSSGLKWSGLFHNKKKNGELYWETAIITPIKDKSGSITHFVAVKEDITNEVQKESELKQYRERLEELVKTRTEELDKVNADLIEQLQKEKELKIMLSLSLDKEKELNELKTRFISTASHEFRTPLTSLLSSAELIQRYGKKWDQEKIDSYFDKIKSAVDYLTHLLDDVLTINRSESGNLFFNPELLDLNKLCNDIIEETKPYAQKKHKFQFLYSIEKIKYKIDPKLMKFILANLLSNAFKYSPAGGNVVLKVDSKGGRIQISVSDEGIGIPDEDKLHLFEPFHRSANSVEIPGTGLGLSIVKRAVELHRGSVKVESQLGKGTEFIINIPKETI